jgi:PAS domain S-box-containing protein
MGLSLKALIVEDNKRDAALLIHELRRGGYDLFHDRVETESAMVAAIKARDWDIVLADYSLPHFSAHAALAVITAAGLDLPCIVVSGFVGEAAAVELMRAGAQDLIIKDNLNRLVPAIERELAAARARREQRRANSTLDYERQLLRQLMDGIPDAICFKDAERRYLRLNQAECSILMIENESEVIGKTADDLLSPELAELRRAQDERVLATGEPLVDCILRIDGPGSAIRWLSTTKAPIRGAHGEVIGLVEIARDITERKRQQQLKDEFVATVSHQLRTPLTSLMASVGCLAGGATGSLPDTTVRMVKIAHDNCLRLARIVSDILDMERIESGNMPYDQQPVEVRTLVQHAIEASRGIAESHGVRVRLDEAATHGVVLADPDRLTQVVTNLLSNAIKFSPRDAEVLLAIENDDEIVRISVRDHGPGIPEDYKDRIFDKFVQVDASDRRQTNGTGLGLSIAKQIVSQLEGEIGFDAAPDGGTIFKVDLRRLGAPRVRPWPIREPAG